MNPEQQMMALAQQQAAQQGVAVGACGPMRYNPNGGGVPQAAALQGLAGLGEGGIPPMGGAGCRPMPTIGNQVQDCAVFVECFTPLGVSFGVDQSGNVYPASQIGQPIGSGAVGNTFSLFTRIGNYWIWGVRSFSPPNQVFLTSVTSGDSDTNFLLSDVDLATYNTTDCFCRCDWGCASITNPARFQARAADAAGTLVVGVRFTLWGTRANAMNSCGPINMCGPNAGYNGAPMGGMPVAIPGALG